MILNGDSDGAMDVLGRVSEEPNVKAAHKLIFTRNEHCTSDDPAAEIIYYKTTKKCKEGTEFVIYDHEGKHQFFMGLYGDYNVSNAVCASVIGHILGVSDEDIQRSLLAFSGVGRRFDSVGSFMGVPVYDDYAHHPTEISSVLTMCTEYFCGKKICAVFEPHQVSRLRLMFDKYVDALTIADHVIITKTHLGREIHKGVTPIAEKVWKAASGRILYAEEYEKIHELLTELRNAGECDIIVVIGAANSYRISRALCKEE